MKIILFGKNGQLARQFIMDLGSGYDLNVFGSDDVNFQNQIRLKTVIEDIKPDYVINTAAYTQVDLAEKNEKDAYIVNGDALTVIANACKKINAKLIHFSTDYVFNGMKNEPYLEDDKPKPINIYGKSKLKGELNIINVGCNFNIIRVSWLMSIHNNNFIKLIISKLKNGDKLKIINDQIGAPTSTSLVVDITKKIIQRNDVVKEIFHLTPTGCVSWYGLVMYIVRKMQLWGFKSSASQIKAISSLEYNSPAKRPRNSCLDHKKIEEKLNILMPSWEENIDQIVDFYIKN